MPAQPFCVCADDLLIFNRRGAREATAEGKPSVCVSRLSDAALPVYDVHAHVHVHVYVMRRRDDVDDDDAAAAARSDMISLLRRTACMRVHT